MFLELVKLVRSVSDMYLGVRIGRLDIENFIRALFFLSWIWIPGVVITPDLKCQFYDEPKPSKVAEIQLDTRNRDKTLNYPP